MIIINIVKFKRRVGPCNLVTIPTEILTALNIKVGQKLDIYLRDENSVVIERPSFTLPKSIDIRFSRKVTRFNRIVIPAELRSALRIDEWEYVNVYLQDENSIIVERFKEG